MSRFAILVVLLLSSCSREQHGSPSTTISRVSVSSSAINSIGYDETGRTLQIEFIGGEVYDYKDVPQDVHSAMMSAPSKGKFFHSRVKNKYEAVLVGGGSRAKRQ